MHRTPLIGAITAGLLTLTAHAGVITAQAAEPPTLVELCAATSVGEVDALLADVAATDLFDALAPLATLTVPQGSDDLVLDADVTIGEVREALGCVVDPDSTDSTDPVTPAPTMPTEPTTPTDPVTPAPTMPTEPTTPTDPVTPLVPAVPVTPSTDDHPTGSVDPSADDGSSAATSGEQVIAVPEGSIDTGGR